MDAEVAKIEVELAENQFKDAMESSHLPRQMIDPLHVIGIGDDDATPSNIRSKYKWVYILLWFSLQK